MTQQTRKDPRAKVLSMTVRYKSATLDEFIEHHSHDVSRGGMFIKTPQPFPPGTLLKFEVRIAEDRKVMQGVGRVVWKRDTAASDAERPAGMGVKFIKLDDDSRRLIDQLLSTRRADTSAYDDESVQGVETEATVGLGMDPLSIPAPKPGSGARPDAGSDASFFPKSEPSEQPPPEDRTVMKQAAELLEEALREVGKDGPLAPTAPKVPSLAPATDEEAEDTKPGRPSRTSESMGHLPAPKMPPMSSAHPAPVKVTAADKPELREAGPTNPAKVSQRPAHTATLLGIPDMASAAKGITEQAKAVTEQKSTSMGPSPKAGPSEHRATALGLGTPRTASTAPEQKPGPSQREGALRSRPAVSAAPAQPQPSPAVAARAAAASPSSGSGRAGFWLAAVAICAAGTWWLWSNPRAIEPAPSENAPAELQPAPNAEPPANPVVAEPAPAATANAEPEQQPAASAAAASALPTAEATPPGTASATAATAVATIAAPTPTPPIAPPAPVAPKPAAVRSVRSKPAAEATSTAEATAAPPVEASPAQPPAEEKPAATAESPAPKPTPAEAPAAAPAPATKKVKPAPTADSDNPY